MAGTLYRPEIARIAARHGLDFDLVEAVVLVESSGFTDAFRHEPAYYRKYIAGKPEWDGWNPRRVASSYGLMQVMYPTALLNGWQGDPEELFLPEVGLNAGCARLRFLMDWAARFDATPAQRLDAALAAYNGGKGGNRPDSPTLRNVAYARKVRSALTKLNTGTRRV